MDKNAITIKATVNAPLEKVWEAWTKPEHITKWAFASDDWAAPHAENDIKTGGKFMTRMESKDGKEGFDFNGVYTNVIAQRLIEYDMEKAPNEEKPRHVKADFKQTPDGVEITQSFDPESENPIEFQKLGWQAILDSFKRYTESL